MDYYHHEGIVYKESELHRVWRIDFINYPIRIGHDALVFDMSRFGFTNDRLIIKPLSTEGHKINIIIKYGTRAELDALLLSCLNKHFTKKELDEKLASHYIDLLDNRESPKGLINIVQVNNFNELIC